MQNQILTRLNLTNFYFISNVSNQTNSTTTTRPTIHLNQTTTAAKAASSLPIYYSVKSLSTDVQDITNFYFLPYVAVLGTILNVLKIIVLLNKNLVGRMYQFLLIIAITDCIKLTTSSFMALFRCGSMCPFGYNYYAKLYEQFFFLYIGNLCTVYGTLMSIVAAMDRFLSFYPNANKKAEKYVSLRLKCIVLFLFSVAVNLPEYVLTRSVKELGRLVIRNATNETTIIINSNNNNNTLLSSSSNNQVVYQTLYSVVANDLGKNVAMKSAQYILNIIRKLVLLCLLLLINTFVAIKFKQHMKKKKSMTTMSKLINSLEKSSNSTTVSSTVAANASKSSSKSKEEDKKAKSEQAVTKMILIMCISCFFGNILDSFSAIFFTFLDTTSYNYHLLFSNFTLFAVHGTDIILIYNFNTNFRGTFKYIFCFSSKEAYLKNSTMNYSTAGGRSIIKSNIQ